MSRQGLFLVNFTGTSYQDEYTPSVFTEPNFASSYQIPIIRPCYAAREIVLKIEVGLSFL